MTSHELAKILLDHADLPVGTYANNHFYSNSSHWDSHGPLRVAFDPDGWGAPQVIIGNFEKRRSLEIWGESDGAPRRTTGGAAG